MARLTGSRHRSLAERLPESPILVEEALTRARSWNMPLTMTLYVSSVGGFALVMFWMANAPSGHPSAADMAHVAFIAAALQLALAALLVPAFVAPSISADRENGTLDVLLLGPLDPKRLVAAKLVASIAYVVLLVVMTAPVQLATFLYAGLDIGQFLLATVITLGSIVTLGALAMAISAWKTRMMTATLAVYGLVVGLYGATLVIGDALSNGAFSDVEAGTDPHLLLAANPFYALHSIVFSHSLPPRSGAMLEPWQASLLAQAALAAVAFALATRLVGGRRSASGQRPIPTASTVGGNKPDG